MGKLNIAHHKSYHPYRRDNIERVRRDEEEARQRAAVEEGRMMLADSEARIDLLRQRAGLSGAHKQKPRRDDMELLEGAAGSSAVVPAAAVGPAPVSTLTTATGHINFFEDLERTTIPVHGRSTRGKQSEPAESEKGFALAPSAKDLNPWYTDDKRRAKDERQEETDEEKRRRDLQRKSAHDPLTAINSQLASRSSSGPSSTPSYSGGRGRGRGGARGRPCPADVPGVSASSTLQGQPSPESARLTRESSERQRALALIARKKREAAGSETPSTVHGGDAGGRYGGYGDVFNRREVEEVRRERHSRGWERDRDRDRDRRHGGRWQRH